MKPYRFRPHRIWVLLCFVFTLQASADTSTEPGATILKILATHPAVRRAELEVEAAKALLEGSRLQPNPTLTLAVSAGDAGESSNALEQNFEISGQPRLRYEQSQARLEAAEYQLSATRRQVASDVCRAWLELWESRKLAQLAEMRSELMAEMVRVGRRRFEVGEIPRNETLRVELAAADATADWERAKAEYLASSRSFALLRELVPSSQLETEPEWEPETLEDLFQTSSLAPPEAPWTLEEVLAGAESQPLVAAMRSEQVATLKGADLIGKERAPQLGVQFYQSQFFGRGIERGAQLSLSFPLFDWGSIGARKRAQMASAQAQTAAAEEKTLELRRQVAEKWNRWKAAKTVREILTEQAKRYQELAGKAKVGYDLGMMSLTDVLQTETAFREAGIELIQAQTDVYRLELDLLERTDLAWPKNLLEDL